MVVPVTTIGSGTVPRRMAGTVAGYDMEPMPWVIVIETWYSTPTGQGGRYGRPDRWYGCPPEIDRARYTCSASIARARKCGQVRRPSDNT